MQRATSLLGTGAIAVSMLVLPGKLDARGGWPDLPFVYCYEANDGEDAYRPAFNEIGCLDGQWRRSNNSDSWDGSTPEPGDGAPGGIQIESLPGEAEDGGTASVLSLEDVGDPRSQGFPDPGNRKLYLWRDTSSELDLAQGVTLVARWRRNPEPVSEAFENNGGILPVPNGSHLHDQNKGQVGFVQRTATGGTLAATLNFAITDLGHLQFAHNYNNSPCSGLFFPDELCLDVSDDDWTTVWMTAQEEAGGIIVKVYLNGDFEPAIDTVLVGIRADAESATRPEIGSAARSYINIALGATPQDAAIQVDYLCVASGFHEPELINPACPAGARADAAGRDIVLSWTNGTVAPASVRISRNGAIVAAAAPAAPPSYTDTAPPPGAHAYELRFEVPGQSCPVLAASIDTCPTGLSAVPLTTGVRLGWTSVGVYDGLEVSRNGVLVATLPGDATSYIDTEAAGGFHSYTVAPTTGSCAPLEASLRFFRAPPATGDFSSDGLAWNYCLDPGPDADPSQFLLHNPIANEVGDLDGKWSSGNGSDSWDGSAPGEVGDPLVDPFSASPGGIGLVNDGSIGAYLFEDTGDPRTLGWQDPSNRKLFLGLDAALVIEDSGTRSLLRDGITFRTRFRLTPPGRTRDMATAPDGYQTENGGKGMFTLIHDAGPTGLAPSQRLGMALDLHPNEAGAGILMLGEGANRLVLPIKSPTEWLDLWLTAVDADGDLFTPELALKIYLNGSLTPALEVDDFVPNAGGAEAPISGVTPSNALYMGLHNTVQSGSMEVDLVCLFDGAEAPGSGPPPGVRFVRGDADSDGTINLTDAVRVLNFLFTGGPAPTCLDAADADDSGTLAITDAIRILGWLFSGGAAPMPPSPSGGTYPASDCGPDPTNDEIGCKTPAQKCR
jgi:hypothetical protein